MTPKIQAAIDALVLALRSDSPAQAVSFRLFVNFEEASTEITTRDAAALKVCGVSMRNLRGEFIGA